MKPRSELSGSKKPKQKRSSSVPWAVKLAEATKQRDDAREAGVQTAFRLGQAMEQLDVMKALASHLRAKLNEIEAKQRDLDDPPVTLEEYRALTRKLSFIETQNAEYLKLHDRYKLERDEACQALKAGQSASSPDAPVGFLADLHKNFV